MPFDTTAITEVFPPVVRAGEAWIGWTSSAPAGTWFQAYVNRRLAWWGQSLGFALPPPDGRARVDIGAVAATERTTDFSASLPASPADRVLLSWLGGSYQDPTGGDDVAGFRVYGEPAPGAGISYAAPLATVAAYPGGIPTDGYGLGGFGLGGFGRSASAYSWESSPRTANGLWHYAVRPFDAAGNEGTASLVAVNVAAPPQPPARNAAGVRLTYTYDPATQRITLDWLASPSF